MLIITEARRKSNRALGGVKLRNLITLIGNIVWFLFFGMEMGLAWIVTGLVFCCTIVGIPYGVASFRIAMFAFFPFGKDIVPSEDAGACTFLLNVIWVIFFGIPMALGNLLFGLLWCVTIVGIPFGKQFFKQRFFKEIVA